MANTCTGLLLKLRECKNFRSLLQIHGSLIVSGLQPHNQLINAYSLFQRPDLSRIIFNSVQDPGVVLWNSMIRGYTRVGLHREALEFFRYMSEKKGIIDPDKYTFTFALKACAGSMNLEEGLRIHDLIAEMGFESDVYIGTGLVEMYCKAGDLVSARQVFDEMPLKDIVTWNTMVSGLARNGSPGEALRLFRDLHLSCVGIDHVSLYNLIPAVSKLGENDVCRCLHGLVIKKGFTSAFSSGLIDMYCKCGDLYAAETVFEEVWCKDDSSWGTMMAAYAHNGSFEEVLKLFDLMRRYDVRMNKVAVASALQAAAYVRDLVKGISIHEYAVQQGMMSDVLVATSLVSMYSKCGELEIAEELFINIKDRDVVSWSAMIASFEQAGHHDAALSLFRDMMKIHVKPNAVTLTSVLPACAGIAACRLGKSIHCYAIKADIESELEIATAIISMYAKSGCFSPAHRAFERLPVKDSVAFNALAQGYT
ncbi:PREDICTED: pentatricopeptide repeat-containing protein At2g39620-like [Camelina sativa]|uniref:Pentatricopeptide repeat-containing protein At2g39620-like n=1 Tax=Camelina sativa TaxID=90675 RepID=A0ABM1RQF5_CAMSA|nr:PREDICTED: pentatricopeptide repeat-containing protein At2g39620-like [Camelina sativa]